MAKSTQSVRGRVSQATGRRRKKAANPVQRAFDDVKQLVSDTGDRLFSAATKQASAKRTAASRKRSGQQRQAAAKKASNNRIGQRRASPKQGGRTRAKAS